MMVIYIKDIISIIGELCSIIVLIFAGIQLYQVKKQIQISNLSNALSLEAEMNDRKEKVDELSAQVDLQQSKLEGAVENWLNSVDRLCFCIRKNYFPEKDWRKEYQVYIQGIIDVNTDRFGSDSRYNHILYLNKKWTAIENKKLYQKKTSYE